MKSCVLWKNSDFNETQPGVLKKLDCITISRKLVGLGLDPSPHFLENCTFKNTKHLLCKFELWDRFNKIYIHVNIFRHLSRDMTKPTNRVCAQRRLRSAWASVQSDQSLRCPHEENLGPELLIERTAKTLFRLGGCQGWSESSLGTQPHCWFCHDVAHFLTLYFTLDTSNLIKWSIFSKYEAKNMKIRDKTKFVEGIHYSRFLFVSSLFTSTFIKKICYFIRTGNTNKTNNIHPKTKSIYDTLS